MASSSCAPEKLNLFEYTEEQLEHELTHYEILGLPLFCTQDDVKKAYRKASLRYHPDKIAEDEYFVFLAVKRAYDCLMDPIKRQAYDSTALSFDDAIPPPRSQLVVMRYTDDDFYDLYRPVFERNLRFDARLRPELSKSNGSFKKKIVKPAAPPSLGDVSTPLESVHAFYEYWIHFESWRDFSDIASAQLEMDVDHADSRYEKRWLQQQIDKRAKQLKKVEMGRVQTLVERAMEADPRLRQERADQVAAKERRELHKQQRVEQQLAEQAEERARHEQAQLAAEQRKAAEKAQREEHKRQLRKCRQELRKHATGNGENLYSLWRDAYDRDQQVEALCLGLELEELRELNQALAQEGSRQAVLQTIHAQAQILEQQEGNSATSPTATGAATSTTKQPQGASNIARPNGLSVNNVQSSKTTVWTKEELSALAKGVKKFPPGGANRWDAIAAFVNNLCKLSEPRSKEDCIDKYNQVARNAGAAGNGAVNKATTITGDHNSNGAATNGTSADKETVENGHDITPADAWTAEQDQQLQDGLAKFSATMDKNERWTAIAKGVPGKSKKECVARFKTIREALKSRGGGGSK